MASTNADALGRERSPKSIERKESHDRIHLGIADDHAIMRDGLKRIFSSCSDIVIAGEARTAKEALTLACSGKINALIMDLLMPDANGFAMLEEIKRAVPDLPVLILTMHNETQYAIQALRSGASGFFMKDNASDDLIDAVRKIASGKIYFSNAVAELLAAGVSVPHQRLPHAHLSRRENEVLIMLVNGESIRNIAEILFLSEKTVSTHKKNILTKMRMKTFSELVQYAMVHHLITPK